MTIFVNSSDWADENFSVQVYDIDDDYETICNKISNVLNKYGLTASSFQKTTIDIDADRGLGYVITDGDAVIVKFQNGDIADEDVENQNNQIRFDLLKEFGFIPESSNFEGFDFESNVNSALVANGGVTTASASAELMMKSFLALFVAVIVILIYVALRFEITAGLAAILALFHDVLITASIMLICRIQINTAFIAALITILGYSINNTIIIFDRIRENLKMSKNLGKVDNNQIANKAVSGTMMRTILTTVTTFIMIFFITVIGVADIQQFAFPIMVGIIAGFYSSVFLTPGLWAIAYKPSKKKLARMAEKEKKKAEKAKQGQQYEV